MDKQKAKIVDDEGEGMSCYGYRTSCIKTFLFCLLVLCSGGFLLLVCYWRPDWSLILRCSRCFLSEAKYVLIKTSYNTWAVEQVITEKVEGKISKELRLSYETTNGYKCDIESDSCSSESKLRYFMHRHLKYMWNKEVGSFELLRSLDDGLTAKQLYDHASGLAHHDVQTRRRIYGSNVIDVEVKSYARLFFEMALDPFYVFQVFSVSLWMSDEYYYYATAIFVISFGSIVLSIRQTKQVITNLRELIYAGK